MFYKTANPTVEKTQIGVKFNDILIYKEMFIFNGFDFNKHAPQWASIPILTLDFSGSNPQRSLAPRSLKSSPLQTNIYLL